MENPLERPDGLNDKEYKHFIRYPRQFFLKDGRLYKISQHSMHRLVVDLQHRMYILAASHDSLGHRGLFTTKALIEQRFWWPEFELVCKDLSYLSEKAEVDDKNPTD